MHFSKLFEHTSIYDILIFNKDEISKIQEFVEKELQFDESCMDQNVLQKFFHSLETFFVFL